MAHMKKYTKAGCGHMFAHYDRSADRIGNENIDRTRTYLNYNLAVHQIMGQGEFIRKRCAEVKCQNRKDVNVMVSWVVTAPKDLPEQEYKTFFQLSYDFLQQRYGRENVVSAYVHMDEVTPHLHFAFVPVVYDEKKKRYKVSAKEAVNRRDLQTFHTDLQTHLERTLGHEVGILNDATREGNKSVLELKRGTAIEKVVEAEKKASETLLETQRVVENMKDALEVIKAEYGAKRVFLDTLEEDIEKSFILPDIQPKEKGLLKKEKVVEIPWQQWQELKENIEKVSREMLAHERANMQATDSLERDIKILKKTNTGQYIDQLKKELYQAYTEKHEAEEIAGELTQERDTLKKEKTALAKKYQQKIDCLQAELDEWELFVELLPEDEAKNLLSEKNLLLRKEEPTFQNIDLDTADQPEKKKEKNRGFLR